jgi:hypothetical protein
MGDYKDIPVKTLDAMYDVVSEARTAWLTLPTSVFEHPKLQPLWEALHDLDNVTDGPVWECKTR